jgi:hypothetical protein
MKLHRKILGGVAALGLVGGLTVYAPGTASAQASMTLTCLGSDQPSALLIDTAFSGGVPIPVTINADVPQTLQAGASADVNFSWVLDAGSSLTNMAAAPGVDITHLTAALTVGIQASNSSGGPFPFPSTADVGITPPNQPTLTAGGQITAGSSGTIDYTLTVSTINITAYNATGSQAINMNCTTDNPNVGSTTISAAEGPTTTSAGGGTSPTTSTAPQTSPGNSQPRVTG